MPFLSYKPLKRDPTCRHPEHDPPGHILLRPGLHVYACPACKKECTVYIPEGPIMDIQTGLNSTEVFV